MNLVDEYLECYLSLTDPQRSKQANKRLLEIEASPQAWAVASKLILDSDGSQQIHGCQLLSQKLSSPLPADVSAGKIAEFVYARPVKTKLHWLCIAKSLLHFSPKSPLKLDMLASDADRLSLLREMPSAIMQTRNLEITDNKLLLQQYLDTSKEMILANFDKMSGVILDLLEYFLQSGAKLGSEELLLRVLRLPIEQTGVLLEQVLNRESFPTLIGELTSYLKAVENHEDAFSVHLSFYRGHLNQFSDLQFGQMVAYVLGALEHRDDADFCESYYLWQDLMSQHQGQRLTPDKSACLENALVVLWRLVCTRCILTQLPNATGVPESSLSLDLSGQSEQVVEELDCNNRALRFRDQAGDFLSVCLRTLGKDSLFSEQVGASLQTLANSTLLELELAVYILGSICESMPGASHVGRSAVIALLRRQGDLNEYLCGKIVELISKLAELFAEAPQCLGPCLSFLAKCIRYSSLAPLASQSCCELLQEANQGVLQSNDIEQFLSHLFELFFSEPLVERTRNNLAKTMVVFIHKFKRQPSNYAEYLTNYAHRLETMEQTKRAQFLQAAIAAQFWMNIKDEQRMRAVFEDFLESQCEFMLRRTLSAQSKEELKEAINLISLALKTNAVSKINTWAHIVSQVALRFLSHERPMAIVLSPLVQLGKAALHVGGEVRTKAAEVLGKWAGPASELLVETGKLEFTISNAVVQVHLTLLQLLDGSLQAAQRANYSPERLLGFICRCFDQSEIWEYELYKNSLSYLTLALRLGAPARPILCALFRNYRKFAQTLWTSVEPLLFAGYRAGGAAAVLGALGQVKKEFDANNPLTQIIEQSLARGEGKTIKNILLALC